MKIKVSKHKHPLLRFPKRKSNSATRVLLRLCTSPTHWVSPWQETTASKKKTETDCIDIVDFAKIVILTGFQSSFFTHNWEPCQANHATVSGEGNSEMPCDLKTPCTLSNPNSQPRVRKTFSASFVPQPAENHTFVVCKVWYSAWETEIHGIYFAFWETAHVPVP